MAKRIRDKIPDTVVLAERQGFDDGYFRNPRQNVFSSHAEGIAYDREFDVGVRQRESAETRRRK